MRRFAALHRDDPRIVVPAVVDDASGARVLTTEYAEAMPFEAAREAPEPLRRQWAETLWTFAYGSIMCGGIFNADPHPGNYLFHDDGRVVFLDFGCVQEVDPFHRRQIVIAHRALGDGDFEGCMTAMAPVLRAKPGVHTEVMNDYMTLALRPIIASPFRITPEYAASVVDRFKTMALTVRKLQRNDFEHLPPGLLFLMRLQFGFYSVLARLDVTVDYAAVEAAYLPRAWAAVDATHI
ncbi:MAG: AarF/UbiB family protein [Myxococcota bacterium]